MSSFTIRNVDAGLMERLQQRSAQQGRSVEEEVCHILRDALCPPPPLDPTLVFRIRDRFAAVYREHSELAVLPLPARHAHRSLPLFNMPDAG